MHNNPFMNQKKDYRPSIIVVGAGAAGIRATRMLLERGYEVKLLEASDRFGGRIWTLDNFADTPLELGAEFVHGANTSFFREIRRKELALAEDCGKIRYVHNGRPIKKTKLEEVLGGQDFFESYEGHHLYEGGDFSMLEFLKQHDIPASLYPLYETFAAEHGTSLRCLGMSSLARESMLWEAGEDDFRLKGGMLDVLQSDIEKIYPYTELETEVKHIDYSGNGVQVITACCQFHHADAVVLTVPLTMLKKKRVTFQPELPEEKQEAIDKIGMDGYGLKIILKFKERFWQKKTGEISGGSVASSYWDSNFKRGETPILTAFAMGYKAKHLGEMSPERAVRFVLAELDSFYENKASSSFEDFHMVDWGKTPFIEGAYSYAAPHSKGQRRKLALPLAEKLFFAGEATHHRGHPATVHGALETAERAVEELSLALPFSLQNAVKYL